MVGFMASGKSSLGKKLSSKLDMKFVDTDKEIETIENYKINEIFSIYGENYFRKTHFKFTRTR